MNVRVAVGLLIGEDGTLLLGKIPGREPEVWEFPGGKCEEGESVEDTLRRELREELGVELSASTLLYQSHNTYGEETFDVSYHLVHSWGGRIDRKHYTELRWIHPTNLMQVPHLKGNQALCQRIAAGEFAEQFAPHR